MDVLSSEIVMTSNFTFRYNGVYQANITVSLAGVPPIGVKFNALCWQSSATAGDAQCTFDCVSVIRADGTSFYPVVSYVGHWPEDQRNLPQAPRSHG